MARRDTAARRYAEAALEIGRADGTLDRWERDLERLSAALADDELRMLAEHPAVPFAEKERVIRRAPLPEVFAVRPVEDRRGSWRPGRDGPGYCFCPWRRDRRASPRGGGAAGRAGRTSRSSMALVGPG